MYQFHFLTLKLMFTTIPGAISVASVLLLMPSVVSLISLFEVSPSEEAFGLTSLGQLSCCRFSFHFFY